MMKPTKEISSADNQKLSPSTDIESHSSQPVGNLRSGEDETTHRTQITKYVDEEGVDDVEVVHAAPSGLWPGTNTLPDQELQAVLSRSYQIGVYTVGSSAVGTDIIGSMDVMSTLLAVPNILEKVNYYAMFRCKAVNLTIRVNASPKHYGAIALSSTVNNSYEWHNKPGGFAFMNNNTNIVQITEAQPVNYQIPWRFYEQWLVKPFAAGQHMTFRMTVAAVVSVLGSAMKDIKVSVFANFVDPEVAFPLADSVSAALEPDHLKAQGKEKMVKEAEKKSTGDDILSGVKDFTKVLFEIFDSASSAAESLAPLAAVMMDKPPNLQAPKHVSIYPGSDMPGTEGVDMGIVLGADPGSALGSDPSSLGDNLGNPSVRELVGTPAWVGNFTYTDSTAAGAKVFELDLSVKGHSYTTGAAPALSWPTYLTWYATLFKYWRGSLKVKIEFTSPQFFTSRIRVVWVPPGFTVPVTIADNESGDYQSEVIEITGPTSYNRTIPWISRRLYKYTNLNENIGDALTATSSVEVESLGTLAFYLVAPIVSADSVITPTVTGMVWIAGGEDIQFSNFSGQLINEGTFLIGEGLERTVTDAPFIAQGLEKGDPRKPFITDYSLNPGEVFETPDAIYFAPEPVEFDGEWPEEGISGVDIIVDGVEFSATGFQAQRLAMLLEALSSDRMEGQGLVNEEFSQPFPGIVNYTTSREDGLCTAEQYNDFVSLGKRYAVNDLRPETANSTAYNTRFHWGKFLLLPAAAEIQWFHQWMTACHVNFRGAMRFKAFWNGAHIVNTAVPIIRGAFDDAVGLSMLNANPTLVTASDSNRYVEFVTPYNTIYPFFTRKSAPSASGDVLGLNPSVILPCSDASILTVVGQYCLAFGDDFAVGTLQSPPRLSWTAPPLLLEDADLPQPHRNK